MADSSDGALDQRAFRMVVACVGAGAALSITAIVATRRFLYADSSFHLLTMWENGGFFIQNPWRWVAMVAVQWIRRSR